MTARLSLSLRRAFKAKIDAENALSALHALDPSAHFTGTPPETRAREAAHRYAALALQAPELAAELEDWHELEETAVRLRRLHRTAEALAARLAEPAADHDAAPTAQTLARRDAELSALAARAAALDAEHAEALAAPVPDWRGIGRLEARAAVLRRQLTKAETAHALAQTRHRDTLARHEAATAHRRRMAAELDITRHDITATRERRDALTASLPAEPNIMLRVPRAPRGAPVPAELLPVIRARYRYEPDTDTLCRLPHGDPVRARQSVLVNGHRLPRAAVIAALSVDS